MINKHSFEWKAASVKTEASDVADQLKVAIDAIDYMPNAPWMEAHGGNKALARTNAQKVQQAQDLLAEVLASLPQALEYMVIGLEHRPMIFETREELIRALAHRGIRYMGDTGMSGPYQAERKGQPKFDQLVGPMYGGPGITRYETVAAYDALSR
jgi:hypothetical protein